MKFFTIVFVPLLICSCSTNKIVFKGVKESGEVSATISKSGDIITYQLKPFFDRDIPHRNFYKRYTTSEPIEMHVKLDPNNGCLSTDEKYYILHCKLNKPSPVSFVSYDPEKKKYFTTPGFLHPGTRIVTNLEKSRKGQHFVFKIYSPDKKYKLVEKFPVYKK